MMMLLMHLLILKNKILFLI